MGGGGGEGNVVPRKKVERAIPTFETTHAIHILYAWIINQVQQCDSVIALPPLEGLTQDFVKRHWDLYVLVDLNTILEYLYVFVLFIERNYTMADK